MNDDTIEQLRAAVVRVPPSATLQVGALRFVVFVTDLEYRRNTNDGGTDVWVRLNHGGWLQLPSPSAVNDEWNPDCTEKPALIRLQMDTKISGCEIYGTTCARCGTVTERRDPGIYVDNAPYPAFICPGCGTIWVDPANSWADALKKGCTTTFTYVDDLRLLVEAGDQRVRDCNASPEARVCPGCGGDIADAHTYDCACGYECGNGGFPTLGDLIDGADVGTWDDVNLGALGKRVALALLAEGGAP